MGVANAEDHVAVFYCVSPDDEKRLLGYANGMDQPEYPKGYSR